MSDGGWVKLWRKSIDTGLIKNHKVWIFWTYCLMKANHKKDFKQVVGFKEVVLQPGQFIFGRKKAAEETALSEQTIRTCLAFLVKYKNIAVKSTNKFSVISVINWDIYQRNDKTSNQQVTSSQPASNQQVTSSQPASNQQVTTNKKLRTKEVKNKRTKEQKKSNSIEFDLFWDQYDKKINRPKCEKKFNSLKQSDIDLILKSVPEYVQATPDKKFRKNPLTYLNNEGWKDEILIKPDNVDNVHAANMAAFESAKNKLFGGENEETRLQ